MAKLGSYYGLCPLIDQHSLLGISEDAEAGHVIVTLGKNIALKYKFSDQKQLQSWRTKDKFSSPVMFNKEENQYMAIFNQTHLRMWHENEENLDKLKKYKFSKPIHTIINKAYTFIVFQNGCVIPFKMALDNRKDLNVEDIIDVNTEVITDINHVHDESQNLTYIGMLVKSEGKTLFIWTVFINGISHRQFERIILNRNDVTLAGYLLCQVYDKQIMFLTLWSDGKLYAQSLSDQQNEETDKNIQSCGIQFASIQSVSCTQFVTMTMINRYYIAIYGADCNQEGASLVIYNLQFKVSQSKQTFKMFSNIAKIWYIENNLLLCVGQNLAVVPIYLSTEELAALVGTHAVLPSEKDPDIAIVQDLKIAEWNKTNEATFFQLIPPKIKTMVIELVQQGLSESMICEHLLPIYIENEDLESIKICLDYFKDISEKSITKLIQFSIKSEAKVLKSLTSDFINSEDSESQSQCLLIDTLLALPCSDVLLLPYLRRELDVDDTLLLLQYIYNLLSSDSHCLPNLDIVGTDRKLIEWSCMLLDASYQKFLLTHDEHIQSMLKNFQIVIQSHLNYLNDLKEVFPLLNEMKRGVSSDRKLFKTSKKYSIGQLNLY